MVVSSHAALTVMNEWVDDLVEKGHKFKLKPEHSQCIPATEIKSLLAEGAQGKRHETLGKQCDPKITEGKDVKILLPNLFYAADQAESANLAFARMAELRREANGSASLPEGWKPKLALGSLVMRQEAGTDEDKYLLCMQPVCEAWSGLRTAAHSPCCLSEKPMQRMCSR